MTIRFKPALESHVSNEIDFEWVCKLAHELNRTLCIQLGDDSHKDWDSSEEWVKDSTRKGVAFHILNPDATPEQSHQNWLNQKVTEGWACGPEKDTEAKTHPCMVPYQDLPTDHRIKDHLFRSAVLSVIGALKDSGKTISAECGCSNFSEQSYI